jgi:hypothetical protein
MAYNPGQSQDVDKANKTRIDLALQSPGWLNDEKKIRNTKRLVADAAKSASDEECVRRER